MKYFEMRIGLRKVCEDIERKTLKNTYRPDRVPTPLLKANICSLVLVAQYFFGKTLSRRFCFRGGRKFGKKSR